VPLEQVPLPLQSELEPQPPHLPLEHVPDLQSELEPQWLHVPLEHVPWPLQSELEPQWPHEPLEHVPNPAQSELEPHRGWTCSPNRVDESIEATSFAFSAW
jgi:hypothetical protein